MKRPFSIFCSLTIVLVLLIQPESAVLGMQSLNTVNSARAASLSQASPPQLTFDDFGINNINSVYAGSGIGTPVAPISSSDADNRYKLATDIGAKWNRWPLWFHDVAPYSTFNTPPYGFESEHCKQLKQNIQTNPPDPNTWNWANYGQLIDADKSKGLQTLIILQGAPHCFQHSSATGSVPGNLKSKIFLDAGGAPTDILAIKINPDNYWAYFVYNAVYRYGDRVKYWQVWNEEDTQKYWPLTSTLTTADYARMVEVTYWAKELASRQKGWNDIKLVLGGLAEADSPGAKGIVDELQKTTAYSVKPYFKDYLDVYALHSYQVPWEPIYQANYLRSNSKPGLGLGDKPIWLTETGICDSAVGDKGDYEMQMVAYLLTVGETYGIEKFFHYQLDNSGEKCGLIYNPAYPPITTQPSPSVRPGYIAYQQLYKYLNGARPRNSPDPNNNSTIKFFLFTPKATDKLDYLSSPATTSTNPQRQEVYFTGPLGDITIAWGITEQTNHPHLKKLTSNTPRPDASLAQWFLQDGTTGKLEKNDEQDYRYTVSPSLLPRDNEFIGGKTGILVEPKVTACVVPAAALQTNITNLALVSSPITTGSQTCSPPSAADVVFETRRWDGQAANSPSSAIIIFSSLAPGDGFQFGKTVIPSFTGVSNHSVFSQGSNTWIAFHVSTVFPVSTEQVGPWQFRVGPDFGGGGTLLVDGQALDSKWYDLWWQNNWSNTNQLLSGSINLSPGNHTIEVYGFENCCDGGMSGQFQRGTSGWQDWTSSSTTTNTPTPTPTSTPTPSQAIQNLIQNVQGLVNGGVLNAGQGNALTAKLDAATNQLNQGNANAARNQLQAFINQVNAFMPASKKSGILSQIQGQALIALANAIISQLGG